MKRITAILCATLCFVSACKKEEKPSIITESVPPTDVVYEEVLSSSTSISIAWNSDAAISNGAVAFMVELVTNPKDESAEYERKVKTYEPRPCNTCVFQNLPSYSRYYVRVKALYEDSESEWAYLGSPSVVETGTGIIEGSDTRRTREPVARVIDSTAGSLTFEWSVSEFCRKELDRERDYTVSLFSDNECKNLLVSWNLPASENIFQGSLAGYVYVLGFPAFKFTGLEPDTDYWFKVADGNGLESEVVCGRTEVSRVKTINAAEKVSEGEYALYEDFEEFIWGGDAGSGAAGYSSLMRSVLSEFVKAGGVNPVDTPEKFFVCNQNNECSLYGAIPQLIPATRLKDWGWMGGAENIICRSGSLRIGNSGNGEIVTPVLSNLKGKAAIQIDFDARDFYVRESRKVKIEVLSNTGIDSSSQISVQPGDRRLVTLLQLNGGYDFQHYTITAYNVYPGDRIGFTGNDGSGSALGRFYIDNISIKVVSY